ncbi:hypothetical protein ACPWT1_10405 [Ramlibacter sp. MMS24-I3-19]|uniref:hypothetical protein n=1 Tax=Ramlibacter sp. MMS24-I3-19 TaxID=3416606 RepID=UPI003D06F582
MLWAATALVSVAWVAAGASGWRAWLVASLVLALGVVAAFTWWRTPEGALAWDGSRWTWAPAGVSIAREGSLRVVLDLQGLLLVRWSAPGAMQWLWLQPQGTRSHWDALRRAVYSRAAADAPSGAEPPSATP